MGEIKRRNLPVKPYPVIVGAFLSLATSAWKSVLFDLATNHLTQIILGDYAPVVPLILFI